MIFKPKSFYNIGSSLVIYDITFMRYLRTKLLFLLMLELYPTTFNNNLCLAHIYIQIFLTIRIN
jgi:hypothetical protein